MRMTRRKTTATRSPSAVPYPGASSPKLSSSMAAMVHNDPPATFGSPALQALIYATCNDRYPGAPGTLLHRAKIEAARALAAKQREAQREAERREELKRLGIVGMGKKRSTANGNGRFATSPATSDRARRSTAAAASAAASTNAPHVNGASGQTNGGGTSTRPARGGNGKNAPAGSLDHNSLPTPANPSLPQQQQPNGVASPLLSASGRLRRPATGSRGASPMPLTAVNGVSGGMMTRTRSPVVPPLELDEKDAAGPGLLSQGNSGLMV